MLTVSSLLKLFGSGETKRRKKTRKDYRKKRKKKRGEKYLEESWEGFLGVGYMSLEVKSTKLCKAFFISLCPSLSESSVFLNPLVKTKY